jgi:hypothetical protein
MNRETLAKRYRHVQKIETGPDRGEPHGIARPFFMRDGRRTMQTPLIVANKAEVDRLWSAFVAWGS